MPLLCWLLIGLLLLTGPALAQTPAPCPLTVGGETRTCTVYVPPGAADGPPRPLVVILHGRTLTGAQQAQISAMEGIADREGFLLAYPDGLGRQWNYGRGWAAYPPLPQDDDAFITALLDELAQRYPVDPARVYLAGLSNGGFMTQRLACTRRSRFAAFAVVAATAPLGLTAACQGAAPAPMLFIHGTADTIVPWAGQTITWQGRQVYSTAPMSHTLAFWGDHLGCGRRYDVTTLPVLGQSPGTQTRVYTFRGCPETAPLLLYAVIGGGHLWHGVQPVDDPVFGSGSMDFNTGEVLWDFFRRFTLAAGG
ncbi:MAG: prolyl oligopeptidase family serine peptidase [Anaerolineae bacterium]|jgi:polyhydroxybutyrate depolymerase|nr:prolyl oligopeptidase family serine peptidase [Anaerolineae bacterium]